MSFMIEEFKKTFQENHQPLFKNIKIKNSSRDASNENLQRIHHDPTPTLNTNLQGKNAGTKQHQQKFFVYVNSPNSPNSHNQKEDSIQNMKEINQKQGQRNQRGQLRQGNNQFNDENIFTCQSQLEETLCLSISDLNTVQPHNTTLNSFRNSLNIHNQMQPQQKNPPTKRNNSSSQSTVPLQNNQNYLNQDQQDQGKVGGNSYLNTYNMKKQQFSNTQYNKLPNSNIQIQTKGEKLVSNQMNQKQPQIKYDTCEESFDQNSLPQTNLVRQPNNNQAIKFQTNDQDKVNSNSSLSNLDKIKALQFNVKGQVQGMNSIQSLQYMLQSNQNFSTQSMGDGNFSITSYGLNQYYLLNMHHIVRIQKFFKSHYQKRKNQHQIHNHEGKKEYNQQENAYYFQQQKMNYKQQNENNQGRQQQQTGGNTQNRRNSIQQNNNSTFTNSFQQPLDINMSNINNVSNSFNIDTISFGQKDNLFQLPSERSQRGGDQHYQRQSFQNQTFEEVEEEEEEEENVQTPIHHYPNNAYLQSSGGFDQQVMSLQRLQSVDIDNIQGRFSQENEINQVYHPQQTNQQQQHQQMQNSSYNQCHIMIKDNSNSQLNQKITQNSPKFPTNIEQQIKNTQNQYLINNKIRLKTEDSDTSQQYNHKPESQQSTTSSGTSSHHSIESLKQENTKLKKMMYQMKLDMKSQLEEGLVQQKNQMKTINDEYLQFIEKIMTDKKELTKKCDTLTQENNQLHQQFEQWRSDQESMNGSQKYSLNGILTTELDNKKEDTSISDQLKEKLRKTQSENDKLFDQLHKQQEYILKIQNEKEDLQQKLESGKNNNFEEQQKNRKKDLERDETLEYLQNQIESLNSQLQDERLLNEELQNQLTNQKPLQNSNLDQNKKQNDYEEELELFKQQFVEDISEKVEELQNQLEKERENVNKLLYSSKMDGNEIINQLRIENQQLKQKLQVSQQQKNSPKDRGQMNNEFDSVKINELETLISQMEEERKQACDMVKLMKDAHEKMKEKYEEEIKQLKEKHSLEFCKYEENIRYTIEKKVNKYLNQKFNQQNNLKNQDQKNLKTSILANSKENI